MNFQHIVRHDTFNHPIATLEWREGPGRTFEVHIDVDKEYHRCGIGRSLVAELEALIADREPMSLYTFMAADNETAYSFFNAVGFQLHVIPNFYGNGRNAVFGVKPIGTPK